jgi:predicted transcriptional regulator
MRSKCERMAKVFFPTVRALIAKELIDTLGLNQVEVARKMCITQPAVSQYMGELRGVKVNKLRSNLKVFSLIQESAKKLSLSTRIDNGDLCSDILCDVCKLIREQKLDY